MNLVWCEVDVSALRHNVASLKSLLAPQVRLAAVVKANAYGHGLLVAARAFLEGGADWLCVNALEELARLRSAGIQAPIYVMGYVALEDLEPLVALDGRVVVYNRETVVALGEAARKLGRPARAHLKLETGNNRQGVDLEHLLDLARACVDEGVVLEGVATHFANIEDTTDHRFAQLQLRRFQEGIQRIRASSLPPPMFHAANSAATILFEETQFDMVRTGIATYGLWPSPETLVSALRMHREQVVLRPALTWKTRVAQVKVVETGEFVGYGCTFKATHPIRLAVLPVGYYDGYDRKLSNTGHVLVRGVRAPVRGRVCMNMIMVDVTDIPDVKLEEEVVLLGAQGDEEVTAEQMGAWIGTINYEVVTRIAEHVPRIPRNGDGNTAEHGGVHE